MRKSSNILIPLTVITIFYVGFIGGFVVIYNAFPELRDFLPVGGMQDLLHQDRDSFEPIQRTEIRKLINPNAAFQLVFATLGTAILMIPISWVYFITGRTKEIDQSFVITIVILPIIVAGIAMIVQNSLALAFSLAGVVAAVRFRFSLDQPAHALYIFAAIGIGLGAGIGALGIAAVISITFVYASLILWKLDYGKSMSGPFFSILTRRDRDEDNY